LRTDSTRYANLLVDAISKSQWTYQQIVDRCKIKGVSITKSYLSKICSGFLPPPSDGVNKVLADVLHPVSGITYQDLALAKYKETIPADVLELLTAGK